MSLTRRGFLGFLGALGLAPKAALAAKAAPVLYGAKRTVFARRELSSRGVRGDDVLEGNEESFDVVAVPVGMASGYYAVTSPEVERLWSMKIERELL